jgi:TatD DNase family protein
MSYIDAHCHLDFYDDKKIEEVVRRARKAGVKVIVCNGVNPASNRKVLELAARYLEIKVALGIYPTDALKMSSSEIDKELNFIREKAGQIIAIGEVGIDLKESNDLEKQGKTFQKVIDLALEIDKPLIVHSRKAEKEVIEMLEKNKVKKVIMHCFNGNFKLVQKIVENGWKLTVPTNVKHSEHFQHVIARVPVENLLCETDSPFLHPDKERDNEPANVVVSYEKIALIKGLQLKEVERKIERNFNGVTNNLK